MKLPKRYYLALVALVALVGTILAITSSHQFVETDDSYYYIVVALNFARLGFPTFDGIVQTNGFHPLYLYTLSAIYFLLDTQKDSAVQVAALTNVLLYMGGIIAIVKLLQRYTSNRSLPFIACITLVTPQLITRIPGVWSAAWLEATEFSLSFCSFAWFIFFLEKILHTDNQRVLSRNLAILTAAIFILFLVRTDYPILVGPMILAAYFKKRHLICWKTLFKTSALVVTPFAIIVTAYLHHNYQLTGSVEQISGLAKRYHASLGATGTFESFPRRITDYIAATVFGSTVNASGFMRISMNREQLFALLFALQSVALLCIYAIAWIKLPMRLQQLILIFLIGFAAYVTVHIARGWIEVRYWYFSPIFVVSIIVLTIFMDRLPSRFPFLVVSCISLGLAAAGLTLKSDDDIQRVRSAEIVIAESCKNNTQDIFVGTPNSGFLSFHTNFHVINLDGLVNDRIFLEKLKNLNAYELLLERGIDIILIPTGYVKKLPYRQFLPRIHSSTDRWDVILLGEKCKGV